MTGGFWSYVHDDDTADGGRIVRLAHDIVSQYEMITGERVALFLDRDDLEWGNNWEQRIDDSLADVAFFIPVLTPRYFASPACRSELNTFARRATSLGVRELLLPILYMTVDGLDDSEPTDDLLALVRQFQWVDWRDLRWADPASEAYRRAVFELAERLVAANRAAEAVDVTTSALVRETTEEDEPDMFERLAAFESELPNMTATTQGLAACITEVNEIVTLGRV